MSGGAENFAVATCKRLRLALENLAARALLQNGNHVPGLLGYRPDPLPEPAMLIHGLDSLIQKGTFGFVLVGVLPFCFKGQNISSL